MYVCLKVLLFFKALGCSIYELDYSKQMSEPNPEQKAWDLWLLTDEARGDTGHASSIRSGLCSTSTAFWLNEERIYPNEVNYTRSEPQFDGVHAVDTAWAASHTPSPSPMSLLHATLACYAKANSLHYVFNTKCYNSRQSKSRNK